MKDALIIIDVQNDYFPGGTCELHKPYEAEERIKELIEESRAVGRKIVYIQHINPPDDYFFIEGTKGVEELTFICETVEELGLKSARLNLDVTLARGLNYYTGAIFEVAAPETVKLGSIGGGGRYDDLTGIFGLKNMSGVGISFGLDRIYLVIEELDLFPNTVSNVTDVLFLNFGDVEAKYCMKAIQVLRNEGIKAEMYPDKAKMAKQFQFADKKGIQFAVIVGETEMNEKVYALKNLATGTQEKLTIEELINTFK